MMWINWTPMGGWSRVQTPGDWWCFFFFFSLSVVSHLYNVAWNNLICMWTEIHWIKQQTFEWLPGVQPEILPQRQSEIVLAEHTVTSHQESLIFTESQATSTEEASFKVNSQTMDTIMSCTCKRWQKSQLPCQDCCAVFSLIPGWDSPCLTYRWGVPGATLLTAEAATQRWLNAQTLSNKPRTAAPPASTAVRPQSISMEEVW